jgi:DNA polymerase III epsilon subunit-like protein
MKAIIFDTETTGLLLPSTAPISKQPRITEIGAISLSICGEMDCLSQLINPEIKITEKITKITGIDNKKVKDAPTFKEFFPKLKEFFCQTDILIAHNAPFDVGMLEAEFNRNGCSFPIPQTVLCTVQEYMPVFGFRPSLIQLYKKIVGKDLNQTHRALDDVEALLEILIKDDFFVKIDAEELL